MTTRSQATGVAMDQATGVGVMEAVRNCQTYLCLRCNHWPLTLHSRLIGSTTTDNLSQRYNHARPGRFRMSNL